MSKLTPTAKRLSSRGYSMGSSMMLPSSPIYVPSTAPSIEDWLTSLRQDSLASPTQSQGNDEEQRMNATSGPIPLESFGKWDRDSQCWRTYQVSLWNQDMLEPWSGSWPKQGTIVSGTAYLPPKSVRHTFVIGGGALPTPQAADAMCLGRPEEQMYRTTSGRVRFKSNQNVDGTAGLGTIAATGMWPTPSNWQQGEKDLEKLLERRASIQATKKNGNGFGLTLDTAVRLWPTPDANTSTYSNGKRGMNLRETVQHGPTPRAQDGPHGPARESLGDVVRWATPNSRDYKGAPGTGTTERGGHQSSLPREVGGKLNPRWVEWLMGLPIGWVNLVPLEMASYQKWWNAFYDKADGYNGLPISATEDTRPPDR
mgnify:FL=1